MKCVFLAFLFVHGHLLATVVAAVPALNPTALTALIVSLTPWNVNKSLAPKDQNKESLILHK